MNLIDLKQEMWKAVSFIQATVDKRINESIGSKNWKNRCDTFQNWVLVFLLEMFSFIMYSNVWKVYGYVCLIPKL